MIAVYNNTHLSHKKKEKAQVCTAHSSQRINSFFYNAVIRIGELRSILWK